MKLTLKQQVLTIILSVVIIPVSAQIVRMETTLGNIDIELRPDVAPLTVANFLNYVNDGDYNNSYFHRSVRNFIIQGGGFTFINGQNAIVPADSPVVNEFSLSNIRGTIAMAKLGGQPNSATSQWFFNTADNSAALDPQNGGFTVFGSVVAGMDVVDAIAALNIVRNFAPPIDEIPLINYTSGNILLENLVMVNSVFVLDETLHINPGLNGSWFNAATSGQGMFFDYFPTIDRLFVGWYTFDTENFGSATGGVSANLGNSNQRWLTAFGTINHDTNTATLDIVSTSGGLFDNTQGATNSAPNTIGTLTIKFTDCASAMVEYDLIIPDVAGSFPIARLANDNVALCERLSREVTN